MLRVAVPAHIPMHGTHNGVGTISFAGLHAAKYIKLSPFSTSLEPSFSDTRGSLNFLTVYSCSQNPSSDRLHVCVKVSTKTDAVMLNFSQWCKTRFSAFSQKFSATTPNFLHVFGRAPIAIFDLQLYFVQYWKLSHSLRDIPLLSIRWPRNPG